MLSRALPRAASCRCCPPLSSRSFFSLPDISKIANAVKDNLPGDAEGQGRQTFHARKILPYSQKQLYALVADVPSYSAFIPFCNSSEIVSPTKRWDPSSDRPFDVKAELKVGFGGFEESYVSRVQGKPYESVTATSEPGMPMFKDLISTWSFAPASPTSPHPTNSSLTTPSTSTPAAPSSQTEQGPTLLTIDLAFTFQNPLHRIASHAVLPTVSDRMVEAFEKRCLEVYGKSAR